MKAFLLFGIVLIPIATAGQTSHSGYQAEPPSVELSVIGSDVVFSPERLRYSVSADPGTYVTVFLISPSGRRYTLNPYEGAIGGSKRRTLVRETSTTMESGEAYLVAVATRSEFHRSNLVRQAQGTGRLAGARLGADASLDELLNAVLPIAGDDFSATYVSFRVISRVFEQPYTYAALCYGSALIPGNAFVDDGFYIRRALEGARYDTFSDHDAFLYSPSQAYFRTCSGRPFDRRILIASTPTPPVPPLAHHDSGAAGTDSVRPPVRPVGPRIHPVDPDGPVIAFPGPATPAIGSSDDVARSRPAPLRIEPLPEHPVAPVTPVTIEPREQPIAPIVSPPMRVHPVDRVETERPQPISEPVIRADPVPIRSSPLPPPPPPPSPRLSPTPDPTPVTPAPAPPPK